MTGFHQVIAAFADGERVDSEQLAQALALPDGREYLIDLLALRELVDDEAVAGGLEPARKASSFRWRWLPLAAAVTAVLTLGGYVAGLRQGQARDSVRDAQAVSLPTRVPAPEPTQVIRLQSGVDWQERIGGH